MRARVLCKQTDLTLKTQLAFNRKSLCEEHINQKIEPVSSGSLFQNSPAHSCDRLQIVEKVKSSSRLRALFIADGEVCDFVLLPVTGRDADRANAVCLVWIGENA